MNGYARRSWQLLYLTSQWLILVNLTCAWNSSVHSAAWHTHNKSLPFSSWPDHASVSMEIETNANVSFTSLEHWIQSVFVIYSSISWESERMAFEKIGHSFQVWTRYPSKLIIWIAFTVWQNPFDILFYLQRILLLLNQVPKFVFQRVMTLNLHRYRDSEPLNTFCGIVLILSNKIYST